jgi:biotin carboxyl carrier protein
MKLQAEIGDDKLTISITREGDKIFAQVDERKYELDASEPEPNVFLLKHDNKVYEIPVSRTDASHFVASVRGREIEVKITDPKRLRGQGANDHHADGKAEIKTAMPGKIVRILKSAGDAVTKNEGVIIVEAMKMQNEMKSPKDGKVSEIRFSEDDTVAAGDVLVVIE